MRMFPTGMKSFRRQVAAASASLFCAAMAPDPDGAAFLDPPEAIQQIDVEATAQGDPSLRCYFYGDYTFIETQAGSPGTGPTVMVPRKPGGARPPCTASSEAGGLRLKTDNLFLIGRKGPFLFFGETDAQGAEPFFIIHVPDGRSLYADSHRSNGFEAASVTDGTLRFRFARQYDAACSLLKEGAACWKKTMQAGHFSRAIADQAPPLAACAQSYKAAKANTDWGSVIVYDVEMTLTGDGKATVLSRGTVGCLPPD